MYRSSSTYLDAPSAQPSEYQEGRYSLFQPPMFRADDSVPVHSQLYYPDANERPQLSRRQSSLYTSQITPCAMHPTSSNSSMSPSLGSVHVKDSNIRHENRNIDRGVSQQLSGFSGGSIPSQHVANLEQLTLVPVEQRLSSSLSALHLTDTPFAQGIYSLLTQRGEQHLSYTIASLYAALCIPFGDHSVTQSITQSERPTIENPLAVESMEILYPCQYTADCRKPLQKVKLDIAQHLTSEHNIRQTPKEFPCTWPGCPKPGQFRGDCLAMHILRHHMPPANM
ncbi:hypothetical protein BJ138DRAFT_1146673 [Hygrophoropsis aurantiaca]|uniref:Uncharacterized protein n=1 Tax=Hygrophoropsis aurantiaca TaxID=72124 RepID=A0ACB8AIY7_9AGAM|nr:hypothetical protein BJ138DRAFT_1146673 [Hygrophoropsis aurantiaca]